jgi:hypothetical protein
VLWELIKDTLYVPASLKMWHSSNTWGRTTVNQKYIHKKFKSRLNSGMLSVIHFRILSFHLIYENTEIKIHSTSFTLLYCMREEFSLTLREEHRFRMSANKLLRRIFEPKKEEEMRDSRKSV